MCYGETAQGGLKLFTLGTLGPGEQHNAVVPSLAVLLIAVGPWARSLNKLFFHQPSNECDFFFHGSKMELRALSMLECFALHPQLWLLGLISGSFLM